MIKILIITSLLLSITSCAPKISNFPSYRKVPFSKSKFLPTKDQLKSLPPKVVVFDFNENENQIATQSTLGKSMSVYIENTLSENGLARIIDRKIAKRLEKEIMLSQINNEDIVYNGPVVADYAVSGAISNATFDKKYLAGIPYYIPEQGLRKTSPKYSYKSEVTGNVKIYEIPSMNVVDNIEFRGKSSVSEDVREDGGVNFANIMQIGGNNAEARKRDDGLVRRAGKSAIKSVSRKIKNAFGLKGYILEKRRFEKKSIFKINLGSQDKIKHGDRFDIFGIFKARNDITGESEIEKRLIATGRVSDKINPKFSWVVLDKKDYFDKVRLGDIVKLKY